MDDFGQLLPPRSVEDVLAERVRLVIGDTTYDLPVLTIRENRAWKGRMDAELGYLLARLAVTDDTDATLALFDGSEDVWLDLLVSYDTTGVLPRRAVIEDGLTPLGLVRAVLEVWRAARPLADIARAGLVMDETITPPTRPTAPTGGWRRRMSSWRRPTAGRPARSRAN